MSGQKKIFSEKEATDLMLKAARMQEEKPDPDSAAYVPGITLDELKRMAKELGVEERYLLKALDKEGVEYHTGPELKKDSGFLGIPFVREYEAVIDGELPPDHFDVVLEDMHHSSGGRGTGITPTQVGRSVKGSMMAGMGIGNFSMTSRNGRTRMNVRSNSFLPFMAIGYPLSVVSMAVLLPILGKNNVPGVTIAITGVLLVTLAVALSGLLARHGHEKMKEKFEGMVKKVEEEMNELGLKAGHGVVESGSQKVDSEQLEERLRE